MAAGKNHLLRFVRIYVNGYDLSGDARTFDRAGAAYEEIDFTSWSNSIMQSRSDKRLDAAIEGFQAFLNDTASSGSWDVLKNTAAGQEVSLVFGGGAAPEAGDLAYIMAAAQMSSNSTFDSQAGIIHASWRVDPVDYAYFPFGWLLHPNTSLAASTQGTSLNQGAATTDGWHANLHILASDGGTWSFEVDHSTNGADWSTLGSFTLDGSAVASEHIGGTGTVNQYVRFDSTRTSGTVTPVMTFARNQ